jgi:hypothetical protein
MIGELAGGEGLDAGIERDQDAAAARGLGEEQGVGPQAVAAELGSEREEIGVDIVVERPELVTGQGQHVAERFQSSLAVYLPFRDCRIRQQPQ